MCKCNCSCDRCKKKESKKCLDRLRDEYKCMLTEAKEEQPTEELDLKGFSRNNMYINHISNKIFVRLDKDGKY